MSLWNTTSLIHDLGTLYTSYSYQDLLEGLVDTDASLSLISGEFPAGINISGIKLKGSPWASIPDNSSFRFVIRATLEQTISDQTFSVQVLQQQQTQDQKQIIPDLRSVWAGQDDIFYKRSDNFLHIKLVASLPSYVTFDGCTYSSNCENFTSSDCIQTTFDQNSTTFDKNTKFFYSEKFTYELKSYNKDGSCSLLPSRVTLDSSTGVISGRVPYQVEAVRNFVFTVSAVIYNGDTIVSCEDKEFKIVLLGENIDSRISWISDSDLGILEIKDPSIISVLAESTSDNSIINYQLTSGSLPPGLGLSRTGEIFGVIDHDGEYFYRSIWKVGIEYSQGDIVSKSQNRFICIEDHVSDSSSLQVTFDNNSTTFDNNTSTFGTDLRGKWLEFIFTEYGLTTLDNNYAQSTLLDSGSTTIDRKFDFTVQAQDQYVYSSVEKDFFIKVDDLEGKRYSNIYIKLDMPLEKQQYYFELLSDPDIFPSESLFRSNDASFGIQDRMTMLIYAGIQRKTTKQVAAALVKNHRLQKDFCFGEIKLANAIDPKTRSVIYEVVYIEIIDPQDTLTGSTQDSYSINTNTIRRVNDVSLDSVNQFQIAYNTNYDAIDASLTTIYAGDTTEHIKYLTNISNMRSRLSEIGETDFSKLPLWMQSIDRERYKTLGYFPAVPIVFCKPGHGKRIVRNIQRSSFDFKNIHFVFNGYFIDETSDNQQEHFIMFSNYDFNI